MASGSKARPATMEKATTGSRSDVVAEVTEAPMIQSLRLLLTATESGHVGQCSSCAALLGAFMQFVRTHAQGVAEITSTSPKQGSRRSAGRKSGRARSGSASSKKA